MTGPFRRTVEGSYEVVLSDVEAEAIDRIAEDIESIVDLEPDDGTSRLFPPGYRDDPERQESFASMTHDDLVASKKAAARAVRRSLEAGTRKRGRWSGSIDQETADAWLGVINDARLVLGSRLGVTEEMDHSPLPATDARAPSHNLYLYLSALEEYLIDEMVAAFPDVPDQD